MTTLRTYIARVQDSSVFFADLGKDVSLVTQQPVHIPYEAQVVLVSRRLAYCLAPFFYQLENLVLDSRRMNWRAFGEAAHELIEELLGTDLEVEGVAAILDANVQELWEVSCALYKAGQRGHTLSASRATFWLR